MAGVIACGFDAEAALIGDRFNWTIVIGAGDPVKLAAGIEAAIIAGADRVLSWGTWGALNVAIKAGALGVGRVLGLPYDEAWAASLCALTGAPLLVVANSTTTVSTPADKAALRATGADVVDFETLIAAEAAAKHGKPFLALRAASDTAGQYVPRVAKDALTKTGSIDAWMAISGAFLDPSEIPALMALGVSFDLACKALAQAEADIGINWGIPT